MGGQRERWAGAVAGLLLLASANIVVLVVLVALA
jgi:hypothetical protein